MAVRRALLTFIKALAVVVLVAVAVSALVWRYAHTQRSERLETMKDDLRNLAIAQRAYAADNAGAFMPGKSRVTMTMQYLGYASSKGVIVTIAEPGLSGWSATARHMRMPGKVCGIFVGDAPPGPPNPASDPGEPACR